MKGFGILGNYDVVDMVEMHASKNRLWVHGAIALVLCCAGLWAVVSVYYLDPIYSKPEYFGLMGGFFALYLIFTFYITKSKKYKIEEGVFIETPWFFGNSQTVPVSSIKTIKEKRDVFDWVSKTASIVIELEGNGGKRKIVGMLDQKDAEKMKKLLAKN